MRKQKWLLIILCLVLLQSGIFWDVSATIVAPKTDEWTTFRHDFTRSGNIATSDSTNAVKQLWNFSTSGAVWSSPSVVDGLVLFGSKDCKIYCVNASNGNLVWNYTTEGEVNSSPAIIDGLAYVGCYDGGVYCMNISSGMPVWVSNAGKYVLSSPAVVDGRVLIGSGLANLYCFNASNGDALWVFSTKARVDSSPAVLDGVVYFACDDFFVYAVNASTGTELWRQHTGSTVNSPCLYNGCVYIGSYDGYVACLNASTGQALWRFQTPSSIASSAAAAYGCIFIGSYDNNVYCLNASTGQKIWQTATGYWVWSSPTVADSNVYVGSQDYNLYCLNATTGTIKWAFTARSIVDSSPTVVNNTIFVGSHDGRLYALALYNSNAQPLVLAPNRVTSWGTFLFFDIACIVSAIIIALILRSIWKSWRSSKQTQTTQACTQRQPWFLAHTNVLCALVIAVFSVAFFVTLGNGILWAADEQTYSQMAYHMMRSGDYLLPWSMGENAIWAGKPPLLMWLISLSYQVLGVTNFATRLPSLMFGVLSLVTMFYLGKKLYNASVGLLSVIVLGTFATFFSFATHAMTDGPLVFFILGSFYFMLLSEEKTGINRYAVLSGVFFGLALMTKQIQAMLIPLIIIFYFAATKRSVRFLFTKRFTLFWAMALLIFAPYVVYMALRFGDFFDCYFVYCVFTRAAIPIEGHIGSPLFYVNYLVTSENPLWVALLPLAGGLCLYGAVMKRSKPDTLLVVWVAAVLGLFSFAQTKLYWYILPALPAFAFAISNFMYTIAVKAGLRRQKPKTERLCTPP